jgi:hypothetical protein
MSDARDFFGYKHPDDEPGRREEPPSTTDRPTAVRRGDHARQPRVIRDRQRRHDRPRSRAARASWPRRDAWRPLSAAGLAHRRDAICVLAMGGSAIGADLVEGIAGDRLRVPSWCRD